MQTVAPLVNNISKYIFDPIVFLLFGAASVVFLWGVYEFINAADNPEARSTGARHMIWGILGMAIMLGAKALVTIIQNTATAL